jgi:outer membrane lipoprotein-sorting protein
MVTTQGKPGMYSHNRASTALTSIARAIVCLLFCGLAETSGFAQQLDAPSVIQHIDASVKDRIDHITAYNVTEHYAVFRGNDTQSSADLTVKTAYRKDQGKTYTVLSESGSSIMRHELHNILDDEKHMSQPGVRENVLVNSANYAMTLKSDAPVQLDGRDCLVLQLTPKRNDPSLFRGALWVDARDYSIVQLEGVASKSHSFLLSPSQVSRQYSNVNGYPMATHAKGTSSIAMMGQVTIKIDYTGYQIELQPAN